MYPSVDMADAYAVVVYYLRNRAAGVRFLADENLDADILRGLARRVKSTSSECRSSD